MKTNKTKGEAMMRPSKFSQTKKTSVLRIGASSLFLLLVVGILCSIFPGDSFGDPSLRVESFPHRRLEVDGFRQGFLIALAKVIGTVAYVGHLRPAPGTWGSLAALPLAYALLLIGGIWLITLAIPALYFAGVWATQVMTAGSDDHDPSEIVVDEVVGQWIALLPVIWGAQMMGVDALRLWPGWITALLLFRFFDITKLGPDGWADRRGDATGVMLDDVIAGVFAAIGVVAFAALFHLVLM